MEENRTEMLELKGAKEHMNKDRRRTGAIRSILVAIMLVLTILAPMAVPSVAVWAEETSGGKYVVQSGDSLYKIAEKKLGDGTRWKEIYELNKDIIKDPSLI